jgi:glycosyltransferase involved in cell wall biosynthesis
MSSILYVWQSVYPWDIRVEKICRSLAENGHQVTLLARERKEPMPPLPFEVVEIPSRWNAPIPWSPIWTKAIRNLIQEKKCDLVVSRDLWTTPSAIQASRSEGIPCLIDMAEHYPAAMRGWKKYNENFLKHFAVHQLQGPDRLEKWSVLNADGVFTVCEEQSQRLIQLGAKPSQLTVVSNTPDLSFYKESFPPSKKMLRIGHHGFMTPERGLDVLIQAFGIIKKHKPELTLVLAGTGESSDDIRKLAQLHQVNLEISGRYRIEDLPKMISEVDVGILPYQLSEFLDHTIANKLFDYMACCRPVLTSETRPFKRVLAETKAGWTVDVRSAENLAKDILKISDFPLEETGLRGRKAVEDKYNWKQDETILLRFVESFSKRRVKS